MFVGCFECQPCTWSGSTVSRSKLCRIFFIISESGSLKHKNVNQSNPLTSPPPWVLLGFAPHEILLADYIVYKQRHYTAAISYGYAFSLPCPALVGHTLLLAPVLRARLPRSASTNFITDPKPLSRGQQEYTRRVRGPNRLTRGFRLTSTPPPRLRINTP